MKINYLAILFLFSLFACDPKAEDVSDTAEDTGQVTTCFQGPLTSTLIGTVSAGNIVGAVRDSAGNFYLADETSQRIVKMDSSGNVTDLVTGVIELGEGIAELELIGTDLYFNDTNNSMVFKISLSGAFPVEYSTLTPFATGTFNDPGGLVHDSSGLLYISSLESADALGYISTIDATGTVTNLNWYSQIQGQWPTLTIDASDNLYVVEPGNINQISQTLVVTNMVSGLTDVVGLDYAMGCLFFTDSEGVKELSVAGGGVSTLFDITTLSLSPPTRVLVDPAKALYLISNDSVWKLM